MDPIPRISDQVVDNPSYHGRLMLMKVCQDETNGLDPEIRRMYWVILKEAPVAEWAMWN